MCGCVPCVGNFIGYGVCMWGGFGRVGGASGRSGNLVWRGRLGVVYNEFVVDTLRTQL